MNLSVASEYIYIGKGCFYVFVASVAGRMLKVNPTYSVMSLFLLNKIFSVPGEIALKTFALHSGKNISV